MIEILKETVVFNGIDEKTIKNILEKNKYEIKKYSPNESIAFRGDEVRGLYIILKGTLTTEMLTEEGNVIKIEELVPSDVIASAFVFGKKNSFPVDLNAKDEAEILFIERKEFLKILFSKEKILENFLNEVSNKTQLLTSKIWNSFNNKTIKKKFCDYVKKNQKNKNQLIIIEIDKNRNYTSDNIGTEDKPQMIRFWKKEEVIYSSNIKGFKRREVPVDDDGEIVFCEL